MDLDDNEIIFLKELLKNHYQDLITEKRILFSDDFPTFLADEGRYEEFLLKLINKFK